MSFHSTAKTSVNRTGVMFYSKLPESDNYRVKFKSFNLAFFDNQPRIKQIEKMYRNYVLFKEGKATTKQRISSSLAPKREIEEEKYKTHKERTRQNQSLRNRLKSMKNDRKNVLQKIKTGNFEV